MLDFKKKNDGQPPKKRGLFCILAGAASGVTSLWIALYRGYFSLDFESLRSVLKYFLVHRSIIN